MGEAGHFARWCALPFLLIHQTRYGGFFFGVKMATDTFGWCVRIGATETVTTATLQAQFGDGYKQIAGVGINQTMESWDLSCNGKVTDMAAVRAFLKSHVTTSFWWQNPWGETKLYRVKYDSIKPSFQNGQIADIAFTFEQAFTS